MRRACPIVNPGAHDFSCQPSGQPDAPGTTSPTTSITRTLTRGDLLADGRDEERRVAMRADAERLSSAAWERFVVAYLAEMGIVAGRVPGATRWTSAAEEAWGRGVRPRPEAWRHLEGICELKRGPSPIHEVHELDVVLVCSCGPPWASAPLRHCHRFLLAERVLVPLGATYEGEIGEST